MTSLIAARNGYFVGSSKRDVEISCLDPNEYASKHDLLLNGSQEFL